MSEDAERNDDRVRALDEAGGAPGPRRAVDLTADEARGLIDGVLRDYGLDPAGATDAHGWRHLSLRSIDGVVGVVEWQPGEPYLVVAALLFDLPEKGDAMAGFYRKLLELNHDSTLGARFAIHSGRLYVELARPIRGLDAVEVGDAIDAVMGIADHYDNRLSWMAAAVQPGIDLEALPEVRVTPKEAQAIGAVLARCDPHGQAIYRTLMERWQKWGYIVDPGETGIGFKYALEGKEYSLAAIRPGVGERRQLILLSWEGLRTTTMYPEKAIDRYQAAVRKIAEVRPTETSAHIEVTEAFGQEEAKALLKAMRVLVGTAHAPTPPVIEEPPEMVGLKLRVGKKAREGIAQTLWRCEPRVRELYLVLIRGWTEAGAPVHCYRPGRIYLIYKTREHAFGEYGTLSHTFNLAALAAPLGKRGPNIDVPWNLATREYPYLDYAADAVADFEATVAGLPGFAQEGGLTLLYVDEAFGMEQAETLLAAMLALKEAGWAEG